MKKTVAKSKSKPAKTEPVKSEPVRKTSPKASTHDPLHSLLRGAHASKICR
jgi:hypothetical protein